MKTEMLRLIFIMATLCCVASQAVASQLPDYPFIHATGIASIYVSPDIGSIGFDIAVSNEHAEDAAKLVDTINAEILVILERNNIPVGDYTIEELQKKLRVIDATDKIPAGVIVEIKQSVNITVKDMTKWDALTAELVAKDNLANFDSTFDRTDRQKIKDGLMIDAIHNAQHNGGIIAEGIGKHLGAATAVSSEKLHDIGFALGLAQGDYFEMRDNRNDQNPRFAAPQALKISQSVDVIFRLK
jgi:uncharacterized protein YggE